MNKSVVTAAVILVVLALWMLSGLIPGSSKAQQSENAGSDSASSQNNATESASNSDADHSGGDAERLMKVQVVQTSAEARTREISLQGQLDPLRRLHLVAQTSGAVEALPTSKGSRVKQGDVLVKLALDTKETDLAEANAQVSAARAEQKAAARLQKSGLQSNLSAQQAKARLASAVAARDRISLQIKQTQISAPFDAILNDVLVEEGELVERGMPVADLIDDSAFILSATATQQTVSQIEIGQPVRAKLITGEELTGKITFLSQVADSNTRSFSIEAQLDDSTEGLTSGISASLIIPVESITAFQVSASAMALGENGEIGIKTVNTENRVEFHPVEIVSTDTNGAWVIGIPDGARVITLGQGFVNAGDEVEPVTGPAL